MPGPYVVYPPFQPKYPSQTTGFAKGAADAVYPNLWNGLVGLWASPVGPDGFNRTTDYSSTFNNGALVNYTGQSQQYPWGLGQNPGQTSLQFDGTNDYVEIPSLAIYDAVNGGSVAFWFMVRNMPTGNGDMVVGRHSSTSSNRGFDISLGSGTISWEIKDTGTIRASGSGPAFGINEWHHIVLTWSNQLTGGEAKFYWDGVQSGATGTFGGSWSFNNQVIRLGDSLDTFWEVFDGWMHSVCWWNRKLEAPEIRILGSGGSPQTLWQPKVIFLPTVTASAATVYQRRTSTLLGTRSGTRQIVRM